MSDEKTTLTTSLGSASTALGNPRNLSTSETEGDWGVYAKQIFSVSTAGLGTLRSDVEDMLAEIRLHTADGKSATPEMLAEFNLKLNNYFSCLQFISSAQKEVFDTYKAILSKM